jgi:site-specific recombinase XerD
VPLNATARQALLAWRDAHVPAGATARSPLFPARGGGPLSRRTAEEALVRYSRLAGIDPPATPHTLRHTFCKALVDAGVPLDRVAVLAGHAGLDTTARYTRPTLADLERAVRRLDA